MGGQLYHADCMSVLPTLPDASVDAIVTDPPYGLAEHKPATIAAALTAWTSGDRDHVPDGKGFMGRSWDAFVPPPAVWDECLRVLKPGGHLLCFAGSRTVDLMTTSIRLAGFEIRDGLTWLYGSGFPKSLDVSKAIDKARRRDYVLAAVELGLTIPGNNLHDWTKAEHAPGDVWWERFKAHLDTDQWGAIERTVIGHTRGRSTAIHGGGQSVGRLDDVTAPATPAAEQWQGWGTALKPAQEPIVLARKPLAGTVAANVLAHGTGALNIDGCRVAGAVQDRGERRRRDPETVARNAVGGFVTVDETMSNPPHDAGRWPSNVLLSHGPDCGDVCQPGCPVAELDEQGGTLKTGGGRRNSPKDAGTYGAFKGDEDERRFEANEGGASRFYPVFRYQAKAPTRERPKVDGVAHPTVKPLELMRWLVRLVTPPGGTVLDPFAGSGTTLQAARDEGMSAIGIERERAYYRLCYVRLGLEDPGPDPVELAVPDDLSGEDVPEVEGVA